MKKVSTVIVFILSFSLLLGGELIAGGRGKNNSSTPVLSAHEEADLLQLREEEKLARDVYLYLYEMWGQWIFENIAGSEQQHMDAVKNLLDKYGLDDPVGLDEQGVFTNSEIQSLYDILIEAGSASKMDALRVGATIEDPDIYDIREMLLNTNKEDLTRVYLNLLKGSRNHLRTFVGLLEMFGESYVAQHLTQEAVEEIVNSPRETGRY